MTVSLSASSWQQPPPHSQWGKKKKQKKNKNAGSMASRFSSANGIFWVKLSCAEQAALNSHAGCHKIRFKMICQFNTVKYLQQWKTLTFKNNYGSNYVVVIKSNSLNGHRGELVYFRIHCIFSLTIKAIKHKQDNRKARISKELSLAQLYWQIAAMSKPRG